MGNLLKTSDICAPLNQLRKKDMPIEWSPTCKEAFKKLTTALTKDSILAIMTQNCL